LSNPTPPRIVVCIPAFNEEKNIAKVIVLAKKHVDEVVVCDDGSTDMTGEIARNLGATLIQHSKNLGKGVAIKDLFHYARGAGAAVTVTVDGDGQNDAGQIPLLVRPILDGTADIVNGSRFLKRNPIPRGRRVGDRVLDDLTNAVAHNHVTDTQSGFRAYSLIALERIEVTEPAIAVDSQILIDASKKGLRVAEVPVDVAYEKDASPYPPAKQGAYVIVSILRTVMERSPLLYMGLPGVILAVIGLIVSLNVIAVYTQVHYFSVPQGMIALGAFLVGLVLIIGAMVMFAVNNLVVRVTQR